MDINFEAVFNVIKEEVKETALTAFNEYKKEAASDAAQLLQEIKEDLETWTLEFVNKELTKDEYEFLVRGQKDLIEMSAIKQAGLTLIKTDELKDKIFNSIINVVTGLI